MSSQAPETRRRILDAAWTLLETRQGQNVRMSDIAKKAGITRQAVYLHFATRAELLIATTRHIDDVKDIATRLSPSRRATTGVQRLDAFVTAWGNYIPEIYGVARALLAMKEDADAATAWRDRMGAVRQGCRAVVDQLDDDGLLTPDYDRERATDILWTLLSVRNWEHLTVECSWSQRQYVATTAQLAKRILLAD